MSPPSRRRVRSPFPDGSKIAKIEWKPKTNAEAPFAVNVPDTLDGIGFIEKDSNIGPMKW